MDQAQKDIDDLCASAIKTHEDLITVLTAQDYQDLTGQVILKIINLLRDLELKLVNVIRIFGVKLESGKKAAQEELYGPAHQGVTEALALPGRCGCAPGRIRLLASIGERSQDVIPAFAGMTKIR